MTDHTSLVTKMEDLQEELVEALDSEEYNTELVDELVEEIDELAQEILAIIAADADISGKLAELVEDYEL